MSLQSPEQSLAPPNKEFSVGGEGFTHKKEGSPINQDNYFLYKDNQGVLDGVSGPGGEIAAQIGKEVLKSKMGHLPMVTHSKQETQWVYGSLRRIFKAADKEIHKKSQSMHQAIDTTACASHIFRNHEGELEAAITGVGDSRVYIFRDGVLNQLTIDDGIIKRDYPNNTKEVQRKFNNVHYAELELSPKAQETYRKRNIILDSLGNGKANPTLYSMKLKQGDILFFSTDGVHDNLTDNELEKALKEGKSAQEIVMMALERSRKLDKIETRKDLKGRAKNDDKTCMIIEISKA